MKAECLTNPCVGCVAWLMPEQVQPKAMTVIDEVLAVHTNKQKGAEDTTMSQAIEWAELTESVSELKRVANLARSYNAVPLVGAIIHKNITGQCEPGSQA